jgi:phage terminase small subunit
MAGTWRSGGKPKPTALKLLQGSRVSGRKSEPQYERGTPEPPAGLADDPQAREHWDRLSARLEAAGVLSVAHGEALGMLAQALADYARIRQQLHQMQYQQLVIDEVRDPKGQLLRRRVKENPLIRRSERIALLVNRLLGEFGLTPATQTRIEARQTALSDAFETFLGGGRKR